MEDRIKQDIKEIIDFNSTSSVEIEDFRIKYLGKKGLLNLYFGEFKSLDNDKKKNVGQLLNQLKNTAQSKLDDLKTQISPGRVYRNEAISARSHCFFHQIEGLCIDKDISFADLKQTLEYFTTQLFGKSKIRLRPSYFPFTEPSAEVHVYWGLNNETDYKMTKGTGWLEIMGCGMVDPNVLENCNIDSNEYSGFAFGLGIDRIALLLHQIDDIRLLSENDVRFLDQFKSSL